MVVLYISVVAFFSCRGTSVSSFGGTRRSGRGLTPAVCLDTYECDGSVSSVGGILSDIFGEGICVKLLLLFVIRCAMHS